MSEQAGVKPLPVVRLTPARSFPTLGLRELWEYRELIGFLAWRDVKVKYQQTVLGVLWALIQPLVPMVIFSIVFGRIAALPSEGVPYPVFVLTGLLPWQLFASALTNASSSLLGNAALLTKVYFPRLIIPLAAVLAGLVDFVVAFAALIALMWWYGVAPGREIVWLPVFVVLALSAAIGIGLWSAALNVQYRDVQYLVPFLVQAWLFASPVAYSSSLISAEWRRLYQLNPMTGVIDGFRWALLPATTLDLALGPAVAAAAVLLISGAWYFRWMEDRFVDVI